ncbi:Uncharacterised protein [Mycobacteroides abscessus subsp. abscessus]|nr:Uncharacterised protein [Mycobacteroides abscessus subsp. abscessus]
MGRLAHARLRLAVNVVLKDVLGADIGSGTPGGSSGTTPRRRARIFSASILAILTGLAESVRTPPRANANGSTGPASRTTANSVAALPHNWPSCELPRTPSRLALWRLMNIATFPSESPSSTQIPHSG